MAILVLLLNLAGLLQAQVSYWVSPTGSGNGSSSSSPASYVSPSFWSGVQGQLSSSSVTVNFLSGTYTEGSINFTNMGNPLNQLTLTAVTSQGAVLSLSSSYSYIAYLAGCQNIQLNGFIFTNNVAYWGVYCIQNGNLPCRNIQINNCSFINLTNAYYAAIGLLNGVRSIQVLNCTFTNITDNNGNHQHIIYAPHDNEDVLVSNCIAENCLADYMRFRDDSEYVTVEDSKFISTSNSTAWPFVSAELYNETNSDSAGDEFFGTYFEISSNSFTYQASGGPGPYSAMHFSDDSWSPQSYYCDLTSVQASALASGSQSYQQSFLQTNMGIIGSEIKMFGNTYSGVSTYQMDYQYIHNDSTAPYNNWTGVVNLFNTPDTSGTPLGPTPVLRNGNFDRQGLLMTAISPGDDDYECLFRNWFCSPKYTQIVRSPGFNGTANALRFDAPTNQEVYQWITPPGTNWTMDCLFAIGSAYSGSGTVFKVDLFHNDITGSKVSVGVNSSGQFGIYSGGTFNVLSGLGTVALSTDIYGDGNYNEPGDTLNVYRLRITGSYAASTPYVNIYTSNANSTNLDNQVTNLTDWVGSSPVSGQSSPETIAFYNFTVPVLVDQVTITNGFALSVQPPTLVSQSPAPYTTLNLYPGETPAFSVSATGSTPLYYQWFSNNVTVATGTNSAFTPANIPASGMTSFYCMVTNVAGSTNSAPWLAEVVAAPTAAYPQAALALNPIAFWPLNEAEQGGGDNGVIAYDYVGGNNGIYSNVVLGQLSYNPAVDPSQTAALFGSLTPTNSEAGQMAGPDFGTPIGNNAEFSVSAWVNGSGYTQTRGAGIVSKGDYQADEEWSLNETSGGAYNRFEVYSASGTLYYIAGNAVNATNGWYHLVAVCDEANSNLSLYVNGALAGQTSIPALSGITNLSGVPLLIGTRETSATSGYIYQFLGEISDVALYGYALSSNQVQTLYEAGALPPTVSLTVSGGNLTVNFTGTLLSSTNVAGPYLPVPGASPPTYVVPMTNSQMFYRANN